MIPLVHLKFWLWISSIWYFLKRKILQMGFFCEFALVVGCMCPLWIHQLDISYNPTATLQSTDEQLVTWFITIGVVVRRIGDSVAAINDSILIELCQTQPHKNSLGIRLYVSSTIDINTTIDCLYMDFVSASYLHCVLWSRVDLLPRYFGTGANGPLRCIRKDSRSIFRWYASSYRSRWRHFGKVTSVAIPCIVSTIYIWIQIVCWMQTLVMVLKHGRCRYWFILVLWDCCGWRWGAIQ